MVMPVKLNGLAAEIVDYGQLFYLVKKVTKMDHQGT
jgi:hypothetical protein